MHLSSCQFDGILYLHDASMFNLMELEGRHKFLPQIKSNALHWEFLHLPVMSLIRRGKIPLSTLTSCEHYNSVFSRLLEGLTDLQIIFIATSGAWRNLCFFSNWTFSLMYPSFLPLRGAANLDPPSDFNFLLRQTRSLLVFLQQMDVAKCHEDKYFIS